MLSRCLVTLLFLFTPLVFAHTPGDCDAVANADQRLACYDRLHPPPLVTTSQAEKIPVPGATVAEKAVEGEFGQEQLQKKSTDTAATVSDSMTGKIASITRRVRQEMVFHLDNGQVWMQVTARFRTIKVGEAVVIKRARLGGYILTTEQGVSTRVKRLQ